MRSLVNVLITSIKFFLIRGEGMARRKNYQAKPSASTTEVLLDQAPPMPGANVGLLVPAPQLRRMIGISAVTLWRWRHDNRAGFPAAKLINGRLYFAWQEVQAWIAKQRKAA